MRTYKNSNELLKKALEVTPLGAQTFSKSYRYYIKDHAPMFIDHGQGCYLWDIDGNKYIDFVCSLGPITVGYSNPQINEAIICQLKKGIVFSTQSPLEVELAEKITKIIPCAKMVRFVKNGSDATTSAIRLARAFTGRERVAMCGYHGMHDWSIGASANNKGIPKAVCKLTSTFKYNDLLSLENTLNAYPNEFAAVILEPIQANGTTSEYLEKVKEITHRNGALLIFDEVVSGFRYALGGASEMYNVTPDMASFGKGMANGMPISVVAGSKEVLKLIEDGIFISTTFGGDAISMAGALATIKQLEEKGTYENFWKIGTIMKEGILKSIKKYDIGNAVSYSGLAIHGGVAFESIGNLSYLEIQSVYSFTMTENGIISIAINNINKSHTEKEAEYYCEIFDKAAANIRQAIDKDSLEGIVPKGRINPIFKRNIK